MINSINQSPAFGGNKYLLVKGDAEKAAKVVKNLFGEKNIESKGVSAFKGAFGDDLNKFLLKKDEWCKADRDMLDILRKEHGMPTFVVGA